MVLGFRLMGFQGLGCRTTTLGFKVRSNYSLHKGPNSNIWAHISLVCSCSSYAIIKIFKCSYSCVVISFVLTQISAL